MRRRSGRKPNSSSTGSSGLAADEIATQIRFDGSSRWPSDGRSLRPPPSILAAHAGNHAGQPGPSPTCRSGAVSGASQISGGRNRSRAAATPISVARPTAASRAIRVGSSIRLA
jgi:hypothetical protein